MQFFVVFGVFFNYESVARMGKRLPYFLGYKRHERVQKSKRIRKNVTQRLLSGNSGFFVGIALKQAGFDKFDIPVADLIPDKVVKFLSGDSEFAFIEVFPDGSG